MTTNTNPEDGAKEIHIIRMMNETESGRRRAMYLDGEGTGPKWLTLREPDIELLVSVGYDKVLFAKVEHVFTTANQPVVQIVETQKASWQIFSAYSKSRKKYLKHGEKGKEVADKAIEKAKDAEKVDKKSPAAVMNSVNAYINGVAEKDRAARKEAQEADNKIMTPEELRRQEAEVYKGVILQADKAQENYGKIQLTTMWTLRREGLYTELADGASGVTDVIRAEDGLYQRDYSIALAMIVDRIFVPVAALEAQGKPFTHPDTGEPITVDYLIATDGLVQKMRQSSSVFARLPDLKDRRKLLGLVVSKSAEKVKAEVSEMQKFLNGGDDDEESVGSGEGSSTKTQDLIPLKIEKIEGKRSNRLILDVDDAEMAAIIRLIRPILGDITQ